MRILAINHIALQVSNLERISEFYKEILGFSELTRHFRSDQSLRSIWLSWGERGEASPFLALEQHEGDFSQKTKDEGFSFVAFHIPPSERDAWRTHFQSKGITLEHETRWTMYLRDPEGNRVGVSHYPHEPVAS